MATAESDPRDGGNFVQPVEERDGTHHYLVYVGGAEVDDFDEESEARNCLLEHFSGRTIVSVG